MVRLGFIIGFIALVGALLSGLAAYRVHDQELTLDGIDVAIAEIARGKIDPLAFHGLPYPKPVRERLLTISSTSAHTAEIARLNFLLGELYAEALIATCRRFRLPLDSISLIGLHG